MLHTRLQAGPRTRLRAHGAIYKEREKTYAGVRWRVHRKLLYHPVHLHLSELSAGLLIFCQTTQKSALNQVLLRARRRCRGR